MIYHPESEGKLVNGDKPFDYLTQLHLQREVLASVRPRSFFTLILGPSAVGKSTIIRSVCEKSDGQVRYITPYVTRPLRVGETDKVSVSDEEFDKLEETNQFACVNPIYGVRYGTPLTSIRQALAQGQVPILDFPLAEVHKLIRPEYDLLTIYLFPPTLDTWVQRMGQLNRKSPDRMNAGLEELTNLAAQTHAHNDIHFSLINGDHMSDQSAEQILRLLEEVQNK